MAKYRKKPVVIEAFLLNERGLVGEDWFWDAVTRNDIITHCFGKHEPDPAWCEIKTLEGVMVARAGDYIIRGVNGEIYPCKADIFHKTYDRVEVMVNKKWLIELLAPTSLRFEEAVYLAEHLIANGVTFDKDKNVPINCQNCTHHDTDTCPENRVWCKMLRRYMKPDGYCSFGVKGETNEKVI